MNNRYAQYALLVVWMVIGAIVGYLRIKAQGHIYEARATLFVPAQVADAQEFLASDASELRQAELFVRSDQLLDKAIRDGKLSTVFEFSEIPSLRETLRSRTFVFPSGVRAGAIELAYRGRTHAGTVSALAALIDAYLSSMQVMESGVSGDFLKQLASMKDQLASDVTRETDLDDGTRPTKGTPSNRIGALQAAVDAIVREIAGLEGELARWDAIEDLPRSGIGANPPQDAPAEPTAPTSVQEDDRLQRLRQSFLQPLMDKQRELLKKYGRDHAEVKEVRQRIAILSRLLSSRANLDQRVIPLLVDEQILLDQYAEGHPKVVALRKQIQDVMGAESSEPAPPPASPSSTPSSTPSSSPGANAPPKSESATVPDAPKVENSAENETSAPKEDANPQPQPQRQPEPQPQPEPLSGRNKVAIRLAARETELASLRHQLRIARTEWLFDIAAAKLAAAETASLTGPARVELISGPTPPSLLWWLDVKGAGVGSLCGLGIGLLVLLFVRASTREDREESADAVGSPLGSKS